MSMWDRTLLNMQRGYDKLAGFSASFAERMKAEINIVRLRMKLDGVQDRIAEQHRIIGKKLLALRENGSLPATPDLLFANDEIAAAIEAIALLDKERDNLTDELRSETDVLKVSATRKEGERSA